MGPIYTHTPKMFKLIWKYYQLLRCMRLFMLSTYITLSPRKRSFLRTVYRSTNVHVARHMFRLSGCEELVVCGEPAVRQKARCSLFSIGL